MKEKPGILAFIICIIIPLCVGFCSAFLTKDQMFQFQNFVQPRLSPPSWLFSVAWTILYILMGIACFFILRSDSALKGLALLVYAVQLVLNFFWSIIFFNMQSHWVALSCLLIMWIMIIILIALCRRISIVAMLCLIPLGLWTTFAAYLNFMIAKLN